ncbi:hypothetical protein PF005_g12678 [Phytophthora fragariae]|uniref:Uncharacterized protein n=1 Tax=Phytophthora fragariae TaxID=53985 RepID=A0A6A3ESJ3_9STRA|nr:hypothetical protein PF009_g13672 [Phytophthora fragariae]KAE8991768.1 hypothetical protein PF011_g17807 [Phytophthora fragariae]KAE9108221.1 hypothetical protein PF010_g11986 [Phytophthora fragariae]KAE9207293.1 hypothetical protein PF005_g12678 [Phytophthora fragariae]KAE9226906.1 hypothetical protein PF004_g11514 [Phytophthora fragariae]
MGSHAAGFLVMLYAAEQQRRRAQQTLTELRQNLHVKRRHWEWQRLVRMRHYITLDCLKNPACSSWMDTWTGGTDENLITFTSFSRGGFVQLAAF